MGTDIRARIVDQLDDFPQFVVTQPAMEDGDVTIRHNQFGAGRATVDVTYTPTMMTDRFGVSTASDDDTIGASGVVTESNDADAERPWDETVLNEARAFVLSGGGENIFAMDLSSTFNTVDYHFIRGEKELPVGTTS